jgi:hypothetical protein
MPMVDTNGGLDNGAFDSHLLRLGVNPRRPSVRVLRMVWCHWAVSPSPLRRSHYLSPKAVGWRLCVLPFRWSLPFSVAWKQLMYVSAPLSETLKILRRREKAPPAGISSLSAPGPGQVQADHRPIKTGRRTPSGRLWVHGRFRLVRLTVFSPGSFSPGRGTFGEREQVRGYRWGVRVKSGCQPPGWGNSGAARGARLGFSRLPGL